MQTEHLFARAEVFPSWFTNALGSYLSLLAMGLTLVRSDATHIQIVAGANDQAVAVGIAGRWRWIEATLTRAHPGGAAGTYDIYVTAAETNIVSTPNPYTDNTNYAFDLAIVASGATPTIVAGTVDIFRKIGSLQWDGAQITRIDQTVPARVLHAHTHATGQPDAIAPADIGAPSLTTANEFTSNQTIDGTLTVAGATTLNGTLAVAGAASLNGGASVTGRLALPTVGSGAGLLIGGDATLYRVAANALRTGSSLTVDGALTASAGASVTGQLALPTTGLAGGLLIGGDASLYRNAVGSLRTAGALVVDGVLTVSTSASIAGQLALPATGVAGGLLIGGDGTLYRNAANSLRTAGALTVDGTLTAAAINASGLLHLTGAGTALTVDNNATVTGTLTITGGATAPTRTPGDNTTNLATTAFVTAAISAIPSNAIRTPHVLVYDDQTAPNSAASVAGSIPVTAATGQTVKLLGVWIKCSTVGGTASVFKVQTDHAVHGTLADVTGLTGLTPAAGGYVQTLLGTPVTLAAGDEIAIVATTPGGSLGVKIALILEYTF